MRFPITATIESARFSARIHSALTTYKKREEAGGFASRGAVEKWEYFIIDSSQGGDEKSEGRCASLAFLYICYSAFKASTTASNPVPLLDLIRTWSPSLSSAFKSAINASLSM